MKSSSSHIRISIAVIIWVIFLPDTIRADDEYDQFAVAKNAFDAGEYKEAVHRFETLLQNGLQNPTLILETLKLSGISYLFIENREAAEEQFTKLLTKAPDYTLDPLLYPIEVVDFFTEIKQKNQKRLDELAKAKAIEAAAEKAAQEAARKAEFEKMRRNIYLERKISTGSLLVAALPFGAGQFQNGHHLKGWAFFSSEILLCTSATVFFFLHNSLRSKGNTPFENPNEKQKYVNLEKAYRLANHISLITLGVTVTAGIVDSLLFFQSEKEEWKKIDEDNVPEKLRPKTAGIKILPEVFADKNVIGIGMIGRF